MKKIVLLGWIISSAFCGSFSSATELAHDLHFSIRNHLIPRVVAKEICSCLFNAKLPLDVCKQKTGLPEWVASLPILSFKTKGDLHYVRALAILPSITPTVFYRASAVFDASRPEEGCRIDKF